MSHTPLAKLLREAASVAAEAAQRNVETRRVLDECASSRRDFTGRISLAAAATALVPGLIAAPNKSTNARVVVVGGGLAEQPLLAG